jgi:ABC-type polysaccharide/polyol phosphate export permease
MSFFQVFTSPRYRELLGQLINRELAQRYKQSVLGYFWVIISPLAQMLVMSFVFSRVFAQVGVGVPYPLFLFTALLPWNLFSQSLSSAVTSLVANSGLLSKIYFPREILVLSYLGARITDFIFASLILIAMLFIYRQPLTWQALWVIPIFFIQTLFTYGLSLIIAAFNLFYRDIQYLLNLVLLIWLYLTPVMYNVNIFPARYQWIFQINPLSVIVNAYREVILNGHPPNFFSLLLALVLAIFVSGGGFYIFKKLEGQFADSV